MANNGSLDPIYERLNGADRYHPFTADTFSDWSMEAGDTITVTRDGHTYESPVHTSTLRWNGQPQLSVSSEGNESRDSVTRQTKSKYGRGGSGLRNDLAMRRYMSDIYGALTSSLILSESMLRLEFRGAYDGLQSDLEFTRSALQIEFRGMYDGLSSHFELTRSQMQVTFEGLYDGLSSEFLFTRSELRTEFRGLYDGLNSEFQVTRSELRAEFEGLYDGLSSEFSVTRSQLRTEFRGLYDGLNSEFLITRSELRAEFEGLYDGLSSEFLITRSELRAEFEGLYDGLSSEFQITRSELRAEFSGMYDGLHSEFQITRSELRTEFSGMYDGLHGELVTTRSELRTEFSGLYDGLSSTFKITRSLMAVDFKGAYDGLSASFELTRSRMAVDFKGAYDGLSSHFETTRSQLVSEFNNAYTGLNSKIEQNASQIGLVVTGTGSNAHIKPAVIQASIDAASSTSKIRLSADHVEIDGQLLTDTLASLSVTLQDLTLYEGAEFVIGNDTTIRIGDDVSFLYNSTYYSVSDMIVDAQVDGNTLKLWKLGDAENAPSVTFSKATSLPDGTWSGGKYTIHAQQNNSGVATNVATHSIGFAGNPDEQLTLSPGDAVPQVVGTSKYISVPIELRAWRTENNEETYSVVYNPTLTVNATNAWNAGEASGIDSVTIDKIIGVKFGQNEYTRTAIGITAFASNTKSLGAALILSNPTEYTGSDGQTHYCVNLTGKIEQNGQLVDGIIGRVNIDDAYHGGSESVTIDKIIGVKFGQNEYTRTAIGITAIASNDAALGTSLTLSEPTTYTGDDNKTHRCINLTGNYVENNQVTSGIIGRVNIDSTYNAGWDHAATSEITTYASHADGATLPFGASVNVSAAIRKSDGTSLSIIGRSYTVQALTTSATSGWDKTTFSANAKVNGNNILNASTSVILQIESGVNTYEALAKLYKDNPTNTNLLTNSKMRLYENPFQQRVYLLHDVYGDGSDYLQKAYISTQNTYNAGFDAVELGNPEWLYTNQNDDTQYTGGATNALIVEADRRTDNTQRKVSYAVSLNLDRSNKRVDLKHMNLPHARIDVSDVYSDGWTAAYDKVNVSGYFPSETPNTIPQSIYTAKVNPTVDGSRTNYQYYVTVDNNYAYIRYGGNQESNPVVARVTNPAYNTGWDYAADTQTTFYASHENGTLPYGAVVNVSAAIRKSNGQSVSIGSRAYTVPTDRYSEGYDADHGMFIAQISGSSYTEVQSVSISPGGSVSLVPRFLRYNGSSYRTGRGAVVTASNLYTSGSWSKTKDTLTNDNKLTVSLSSTGSLSALSYVISATAGIAYDESTHKYTASAVAKVDGTQRGETSTDVSGLEAYYAGKASVTINSTMEYTTAKSSGITATSNTLKVNTQNRTNASGESVQSTKTVNLYTESSSDGLTATFYVREGTNSADNRILKKTQTCSDANLVAGNIKSGVSIFGVAGSYAPSSTVIQPTGVTLSTQKANTLTWNFYVTTSNSSTGPFECDLTSVYNAGGKTAHIKEVERGASYAKKTQNQTLSNVEVSTNTTLYYRIRPRYGTGDSLVDETNFFYFNQPLTYKDGGSSSYTSRNLYCSSVSQTRPGATTNYYYFRLEGNYDFSAGTSYKFYRSSWQT